MVYGFAKKSGGIVQIYSELGLGTTVSFYLPIVADSAHSAHVDTPKSSHANLAGTVLVVDDELDILEVAATYLTEMGLTVIQARDGAEGLRMIAEHPEIDLIVTDIVMAGGMNGEDLVRRARASQPGLKVIYSSGFPAEVLAKRTMQLVEGPLLRKPYQWADFVAVVQGVMETGNNMPPGFKDSLSARDVQQIS